MYQSTTHYPPSFLRQFDNPLIIPLTDMRTFDVPQDVIDPDAPRPLTNPIAIALAAKFGYQAGFEFERCNDDPVLILRTFEDGCRRVENVRRCGRIICLSCREAWAKKMYYTLLPRLTLSAIPWFTLITLEVLAGTDPFALRERLRRHLPRHAPMFVHITYTSEGHMEVRVLNCGQLSKAETRALLLQFGGKPHLTIMSKDEVKDLLKIFLKVSVPMVPSEAADFNVRYHNRVMWSEWNKKPTGGRVNTYTPTPIGNNATSPQAPRHAPILCCHGKKCIASTPMARMSDIRMMGTLMPFILEHSPVRRN